MRPVVAVAESGRGPPLRRSVTKLQLSRWRGEGMHFRQSSITKTARSREGERKSKVMEREESKRAGVVATICFVLGLFFFFLRGNKRKQEIVLLVQIAVTDPLYSGCLTLHCYCFHLNRTARLSFYLLT